MSKRFSNPIPNWEKENVEHIIGRAATLGPKGLQFVVDRLSAMAGRPVIVSNSGKVAQTNQSRATSSTTSTKVHVWEIPIMADLEIIKPLHGSSKEYRKSAEGVKLLAIASAAHAALQRAKRIPIGDHEMDQKLHNCVTKEDFTLLWKSNASENSPNTISSSKVSFGGNPAQTTLNSLNPSTTSLRIDEEGTIVLRSVLKTTRETFSSDLSGIPEPALKSSRSNEPRSSIEVDEDSTYK